MNIAIIAAVDHAWGIAKEGKMPWHIPDEFKLFKKLTNDCPIIFGRKTWESIDHELPGRDVIVLSRDEDYIPKYNARVANNPYHAMGWAIDWANSGEVEKTVFIGGGAEIYKLYLSSVLDDQYKIDTMYISEIHDTYDCDQFFPFKDFPHIQWALERNRAATLEPNWDFLIYKRLSTIETEIVNSFQN